MTHEQLNHARTELSVKAKNGMDFILAATIIWIAATLLWTLPVPAYNKSVFQFIASGPLLPLAFAFSKLLKTDWKVKGNPLQSLGLLLNFAQFFYFPLLVFVLLKMPDYFMMTYAIITGAHFFPYAWFYNTRWFGIFAGIVALGALAMGLYLPAEKMYLIGAFTCVSLIILFILLIVDYRSKKAGWQQPA